MKSTNMESCSDRLSPSSDLTNESETSLPQFPYEGHNGNFYQGEANEKQYFSCKQKTPMKNEDRKDYLQESNRMAFDNYLTPQKNKKYLNFELKLPPNNDIFFSQINGDERMRTGTNFYEQNLKSCAQNNENNPALSDVKIGQVSFENVNERDRVTHSYFNGNENTGMRRCLNFNSEQVGTKYLNNILYTK